MLEMGLVVAIGLIAMFCKLSWKWRIRLLSYPLALDLFVFVALNALHWGTFSGVMVAAVGALFCSMCISLGRRLFGYVERGHYIPGKFNIYDKLR
jgi:hypothetical protein